jgi:hypothetical protein
MPQCTPTQQDNKGEKKVKNITLPTAYLSLQAANN